jgi:hypothetical protein
VAITHKARPRARVHQIVSSQLKRSNSKFHIEAAGKKMLLIKMVVGVTCCVAALGASDPGACKAFDGVDINPHTPGVSP